MKKKDIFNLKNKDFGKAFFQNSHEHFEVSKNPIQVHDIAVTTQILKLPTPLHRPNYNYFVLITQGEARQLIETELVQIKANEILFIKQGTVTAIQAISKDIQGYVITIEDDTLSTIINSKELINLYAIHSVTQTDKEIMGWINDLITLLSKELTAKNGSSDTHHALIKAFIHKLLSLNASNFSANSRSAELLFQFKELVYTHCAAEKSVIFYANALEVSPNYLNRCVKERTSLTVKEWINKISILQSQILLQNTTKDIAEIAFELQFEDPSYFGRLFKKLVGITPSKYRQNTMHVLSD
jgi:AraC family transcriptional regulator, transcriptional activator of pobA